MRRVFQNLIVTMCWGTPLSKKTFHKMCNIIWYASRTLEIQRLRSLTWIETVHMHMTLPVDSNHRVWFSQYIEIMKDLQSKQLYLSHKRFFRTILKFIYLFLTNSIHDAKFEVENTLVPNGQLCQVIHSKDVGWEYIQFSTWLQSALYIATFYVMMQSLKQMVVTSFNVIFHHLFNKSLLCEKLRVIV
jgi:hypothetical protein